MNLAQGIRCMSGKGGLVGALLAIAVVVNSMPAAAAELLPVRIGLAHTAESGPLYIAVANGYFRDEDLDAQLKFFASDALVPGAAATGQVDIGVTNLDAAFFGHPPKHGFHLLPPQAPHP